MADSPTLGSLSSLSSLSGGAFWERFNETVWERTPAHLGKALPPLLGREEIFRIGVTIGDGLGNGDPVKVRWCGDGKRVELLPSSRESAALLPLRSDRNLAGYEARMASHPMFFYQVPMLQQFYPALWPRLVAFAKNFYPKTGTPANMAWTDAYFGRYTSTPFGVHLDGASNFTFGLDGHKTLYLWEPDFFHAHMRGVGEHDYEPFLPQATKLTVGPGEAIYWPGRYFHIAVPDGIFSVTMNYAFYADEAHGTWLARGLSDLLKGIESEQKAFHAPTISKELAALCQDVVARASGGGLERLLLRRLVEHTTRLGFEESPPPRAPVHFEAGDRVVLTPGCELTCISDGGGGLVVSANGYSMVRPDEDKIQSIVRGLRAGQPILVDSETAPLAEEMHRWAVVERYWG